MVTKIPIHGLLDIEDIPRRTDSLRRAFSAYTDFVDLTGKEYFSLVVLLNLSHKKGKTPDLLDLNLARLTVKNHAHIDKCLSEVAWLHTHNLKYPDTRVSGQSLLVDSPSLHSYILSSANCIRTLGWSHDSARVNFSKLFCCHFIWNDKVTCLAHVLCEMPKEWKAAFKKLGMAAKHFEDICNRLRKIVCTQTIPDKVDRYSIQVLMPYRDNYLATTPVISHAFQAELQREAIEKRGSFTKLQFSYPGAVSELVASLGGNVYVLNYPPAIRSKTYDFKDSALNRLKTGKSILNNKALATFQFAKVLDGLLNTGLALALKQRRQQRLMCLKQLRRILYEWLEPVIEYRSEMQSNMVVKHVVEPEALRRSSSIEYKLLTFPRDELSELVLPLFNLMNSEMSQSGNTNKYAFHQKLMPTLFKTLASIVNKLAFDKEVVQLNDENLPFTRYLYLKGIRVSDAQALSSPYSVGIPSLTAVWGMMHNYQRQLNERLGTELRMTSFSWFIREYSFVKGKKLPEFGMHGRNEKEFRRSAILDNRYCDLAFDLVIHIHGYEHDLELLDLHRNIVKATFPSRFAGGVMHPPVSTEQSDWCSIYKSEAMLFSKLKKLPIYGKWVVPTRLRVKNLTHLLSLLKLNTSLNPTMLGYLPLTRPDKRLGSHATFHSYAEPALGVVECASAIEIRLQGQDNFFRRAFWMLEANEYSILMKRI